MNWYDTLTLQPLPPRYISTVDSGNLAASFIVTAQACRTLPIVRGVYVTKWHAVFWSAALIPVSLALVPLGVAGMLYLCIASVLGGIFLLYAIRGFWAKVDETWARSYFLYSLVYLTTLFVALLLDAGPSHVA